jgi:hypothetical protein
MRHAVCTRPAMPARGSRLFMANLNETGAGCIHTNNNAP